jgi:hypothetical protein
MPETWTRALAVVAHLDDLGRRGQRHRPLDRGRPFGRLLVLTASPAMTVGMGDGRLFLNQADHRAVAPGTSGLPRRSRP